MKKGLSVLLIAAALFGFYGGATSLNDVLASKDYWEEVGEKSTADMNKLEDGLNQLKDNEKAYLDGQKTLAEGEKTLADGEAQYAQGLADYAAAPAKLADARRQIADGEEQLAEGAANLNKLGTAVAGINKILNGYNKTWKPGYETLKKGRLDIAEGVSGAYSDLSQLAQVLAAVDPSAAAAYTDALDAIAEDADDGGVQNAKAYKAFIKNTNTLQASLIRISELCQANYDAANSTRAALSGLADKIGESPSQTPSEAAVTAAVKYCGGCAQMIAEEKLDSLDAAARAGGGSSFKSNAQTLAVKYQEYAAASEEEKQAAAAACYKAYFHDNNGDAVLNGITYATGYLKAVNDKVNGDDSKLKNKLIPGLKKFNGSATDTAVDQLVGGQDEIAGGIRTIASGVLGNKTLKDGVKKAMGASAITLLQIYSKTPNRANSAICDFAKFEAQMDTTPGLVAMLQKARGFLGNTIDNGTNEYNAGLKKLNAGKAEYAQGLADYAAAPAKLADAEKQLEDGRKQLADGKKKLAEYEDGEQQVRDGLATLMATEADPGLESILDRRNGDDKFDDANGHLQLDEGLEAVDTGRGYQAESGELITKEVTNRAVGTAAGLGAAALAVLAAILSFLKKNKGAAVSAVLAAVAGGIGAGVGLSAGEYYSDIAGSTIGNTPFIAAAILAVVAAVFAIVHFTAKPEAK